MPTEDIFPQPRTISDVVVSIRADTSEFDDALDESRKKVAALTQDVDTLMGKLASLGGAINDLDADTD